MLGTSARGTNRRAARSCPVGPGTRVRYQGDRWEVWALSDEMFVTLLRDGQRKPRFVQVQLREVEVDRAP